METHAPIVGRRHLFIDESLIARSDGVRLTVNPPRKTNDVLIAPDRAWEDRFVGPYCTVMDDDGVYRMWYESYYADETGKRQGVLCHAESNDGRAWRKPDARVVEFRGSTSNNIVFPPPGKLYHGGTVFKDPTAPPDQRYKIIYMTTEGVFGGYSPDGLSWRVYDGGPLMFHQSDTQNVCFWDDRIHKYVAYVRMNRPVRDPNRIRHIGRSETTGFLNWPAAQVVLSYDADDPPDIDLYNSAAIKYPRADDVYFIITSYFNNVTDTMEPRLAISRDGVHWDRPSREPFIPRGEDANAFDSKMIHMSVGQFQRGDEWWAFYRGTNQLHSTHGHTHVLPKPTGVISRVVSRLDGYVSLDAPRDGTFTTIPLQATAGLELNYTTAPGGSIRVDMCDMNEKPLVQCAEPLVGDQIAGVVRWTQRPPMANQPIRLRFHMVSAKLFSFRFTESANCA